MQMVGTLGMNTADMINAYLDGLDEEERALTLAADDALDNLCAHYLSKKYDVEVVCNPGGDRSKIQIDGIVMDMESFMSWLMLVQQQNDKAATEEETLAHTTPATPTVTSLPTEVEIPFSEIPYGEYEEISPYLRNTYDHYLSGKEWPNRRVTADCDRGVYVVTDIKWGRKR